MSMMDEYAGSPSSSALAADVYSKDGCSKTRFKPNERNSSSTSINFGEERWLTMLDAPCTFPPETFFDVMLNLVKNPNLTSSQLFRADIFYDSNNDRTTSEDDQGNLTEGSLAKHMKVEYRPIRATLLDFILRRTVVRNLVPRNPQRDRALVQTCHFFHRHHDDGRREDLVLYIPHATGASEMPFYHPTVQRLAFHHIWKPEDEDTGTGLLSIHFQLYPAQDLTTRLSRIALKLLQTVHKHGQGLLAGYEKRVHLDQVIPQKRFQDTYARLKAQYGKQLASQWVEVTDPGKHVFEDLGIAAFLIELWRDMYAVDLAAYEQSDGKPRFPGFVDIGCGNGVLTYILLAEGYMGQGFDARERKTWSIFPEWTRAHLHRRLLVPEILQRNSDQGTEQAERNSLSDDPASSPLWHNGVFPKGTFIISNHADELTTWTPLLAHLSGSPFIAIPCCSHDFSGARFRAPMLKSESGPKTTSSSAQLLSHPIQSSSDPERHDSLSNSPIPPPQSQAPKYQDKRTTQAAETGSLGVSTTPSNPFTPATNLSDSNNAQSQLQKQKEKEKKAIPSAYSSLCAHVMKLTEEVGFVAETETLRIPSTRNICIVGRHRRRSLPTAEDGENLQGRSSLIDRGNSDDDDEERKEKVRMIVEREMKRDIDVVGREWIARATRLGNKPGSGH